MQNSFIPDAIEIVSRAITADNDGEYDKALSLYRDALSRFTIGLKYEKNESKKVRHIIPMLLFSVKNSTHWHNLIIILY